MKKIKYLVMDVEGTLTDGKIFMGNNGEACKTFNIKDGCGIHDIAIPAGIIPIVITGRKSRILENRCRELEIPNLYQGIINKFEKIKELIDKTDYDKVAYIGDDINDLESMAFLKNADGLVGCPADASKQVMQIAHFISNKNGGEGAVREFIDFLIEQEIF